MINKNTENFTQKLNLFPIKGKNIELNFNGDRSDVGLLTKSANQNDAKYLNSLPIENYSILQETAIQENGQIQETTPFIIFPNPVNSDFSVCYSLNKEPFVRIEIFEISGKKIRTLINLNNQEDGEYFFNFSINELNRGMYLIVLNTNKKRIPLKIIKH